MARLVSGSNAYLYGWSRWHGWFHNELVQYTESMDLNWLRYSKHADTEIHTHTHTHTAYHVHRADCQRGNTAENWNIPILKCITKISMPQNSIDISFYKNKLYLNTDCYHKEFKLIFHETFLKLEWFIRIGFRRIRNCCLWAACFNEKQI